MLQHNMPHTASGINGNKSSVRSNASIISSNTSRMGTSPARTLEHSSGAFVDPL